MPAPRSPAFLVWPSQLVICLCTSRLGTIPRHTLVKGEVLIWERLGPPTALGQFELAIAQDPETRLGAHWPTIASEHSFILLLMRLSLGPWPASLLYAAVEQTLAALVNGMTPMGLDELRELEAKRLERVHAVILL